MGAPEEARATGHGERVGRDCLRQRLWQLFAYCLRRAVVTTNLFLPRHLFKHHSTSAQIHDPVLSSLPSEPFPSPQPTSKANDNSSPASSPSTSAPAHRPATITMALDNYYHNKIEAMKLEILKGQAVLRRLEAQRNDYNSRVRLLREELGLLQQPGSYVGEVVKVMSTKKVLVKVHPEGKYGMSHLQTWSHLPNCTPNTQADMKAGQHTNGKQCHSRRCRRLRRHHQAHRRKTSHPPLRLL